MQVLNVEDDNYKRYRKWRVVDSRNEMSVSRAHCTPRRQLNQECGMCLNLITLCCCVVWYSSNHCCPIHIYSSGVYQFTHKQLSVVEGRRGGVLLWRRIGQQNEDRIICDFVEQRPSRNAYISRNTQNST